jgi:hypothetical protein
MIATTGSVQGLKSSKALVKHGENFLRDNKNGEIPPCQREKRESARGVALLRITIYIT